MECTVNTYDQFAKKEMVPLSVYGPVDGNSEAMGNPLECVYFQWDNVKYKVPARELVAAIESASRTGNEAIVVKHAITCVGNRSLRVTIESFLTYAMKPLVYIQLTHDSISENAVRVYADDVLLAIENIRRLWF